MSDPIQTRIGALRQRILIAEAAYGVAWVIMWSLALFAVWLVVDYWFVTAWFRGGWDLAIRLVLVPLVLAAIGFGAWRKCIQPLRRHRSDDEIAMRIECAYPELDGIFISALQLGQRLANRDRTSPPAASLGLIQACVEQGQERAASVDYRRGCDVDRSRRAAILAGCVLSLAIVLAILRSDIASAAIARFVLLQRQYPTDTRIVAVRVPALVAAGDQLPIEIEVDEASKIPEDASAEVRTADGGAATVHLRRITDPGPVRFRGMFERTIADVTVRPHAGDHVWPQAILVGVRPRPSVGGLSITCIPPEYLGMPAFTSESGDIRVHVGSRIEVRARFSTAVRSSTIAVRPRTGDPAEAEMRIQDGTGMSADGAFTADADGTWSIHLVGADDLGGDDPPRWTITVIPDKDPVVAVTFPGREQDATPNAMWPVRYRAKDDHGLSAVRIRWQSSPRGGDAATGRSGVIELPMRQLGTEDLVGEAEFDLTGLALYPGMRLTWWIEAADRRTPTPGIGSSPKSVFSILDPAELREKMARSRKELAESLKHLRDGQDETKAGVEGILKSTSDRKKE